MALLDELLSQHMFVLIVENKVTRSPVKVNRFKVISQCLAVGFERRKHKLKQCTSFDLRICSKNRNELVYLACDIIILV